MKKCELKNICLILLLFVIAPGFGQTVKASEEHVPEGITMQAEFKPGYGETLGLFKKTIGRVVLIHTADTFGYWADNELPLYMKDTVVTPEEGLALLQFLDESTISVAEDSELTINRFIFDPEKFDRSTFINMKTGRSRFWVKKLQGYTRSEFKVKTKTMVAGVRGSDFVIEILKGVSKITAFADTVIEVFSLHDPGRIVVVRSNQSARVKEGQGVSPVENVSPSEITRLKNLMPMPFDQGLMSTAGIFETEGTADSEKEDSEQEQKEETVPAGQAAPEVAVKKETVPTGEPGASPPAAEQPPGAVPAGQAAPEVAVKKEIVPVEEPGTSPTEEVQPEITTRVIPKEEIQHVGESQKEEKKAEEEVVYRGGNILYPAEELVPPDPLVEIDTIVEDPVIDWPQESLSSPPGTAPAIYDIADGSSPSPAPVPSEIFVPTLTELPGLPGTPVP